jgi:dUTP pyrophosphatase
LCNAVGVIDSGYRGEIMLKFDKSGDKEYEVGDRVGQLMLVPIPSIQFVQVANLPDSDRGLGGFGSTGN